MTRSTDLTSSARSSLSSSFGSSLTSSVGWAVAYALAIEVGRVVSLTGATLAIIWPACGVATLWLLGRRGPLLALDAVLLAGTTLLVNDLTGVPLALSAWLALVNLAQALVAATALRLLIPDLWGCGGTATFDSVRRLIRLLGVAVVSSLLAALIAGVGLAWLAAQPTPLDLAIHWGRNIYGFLAVVTLVHLVAHAWRFRDPELPALPHGSGPELALLASVTLLVFGIAFLQSSLPLAFVPATVTIWAGLRFSPPVVAVHGTLAGALAVGATMAGLGPFALVDREPVRGLLVQLLMSILIVKGLSLAGVRSHQKRLLRAVEEGRREATTQAALLGTIMDTIQPGLVVLDRAGSPTRTNQPATTLLAMHPTVSSATSVGVAVASPAVATSPTEAWASVWTRLAASQAPACFDLQLEGPEDAAVVEVRPTPMSEGGRRTGTVVLLTDVTAERAARDGLTGFAGTVAHDLRGPLTGVTGWSHALADELEGDADLDLASAMVGRVVTAASRMDDLISDLLAHAVSRDGALHPSTLSLERIALEVAESLGTEGHVVVHDLVEVHADEALVRHLVTNLVGNAVKYVAPDAVPSISVHARSMGDMVEVGICDNGIGIPEDQRDRVFEQFHRVSADYPGTGLGLSICRTIVERHGGEIRADAAEGGGTCVVFTLPAPPRTTTTSPTVSRPTARTPQRTGPRAPTASPSAPAIA